MLIPILAFLWVITIYFVALTGSDHIVTGKIDPNVREEIFRAYVFWESIGNQAVAAGFTVMFIFLGLNTFGLVLVYATVSWCWFGGGLDFLYFGMKGEMPPLNKVWGWMPFNPKTWQFAIYAVATFVLLVIGWIIEIGVLL